MASPQLEHGFVRLSNELLEAIIAAGFSRRELVVILATVRETYGWNSKLRRVTAYRIAKLTGVHRTHISHAVRGLVSRNVLIRDGERLGIQKDYEQWGTNHTGVQIVPGTDQLQEQGTNRTGRGGTNRHSIKDKRKTRKDTPSGMTEILAAFESGFEARFGKKPTTSHGKDGTLAKALLGKYGADETKVLLARFFQSADDWIRKSGYTFGAFYASVNKLIAQQSTKPSSRARIGDAWKGRGTGEVKL